jgi:hypothetical protein
LEKAPVGLAACHEINYWLHCHCKTYVTACVAFRDAGNYLMRRHIMARPRLKFTVAAGAMDAIGDPGAGYRIYAGYQRTPAGGYVGTLKVVRLRDSKLLYPFDGVSEIGPCSTGSEARRAAERVGGNVVLADTRSPEP